jgi:hypothetical protein
VVLAGFKCVLVAKTFFRSRVTKSEATPFLFFLFKLIINLFSSRWYCIIRCRPACWRAQQLRRLQAVNLVPLVRVRLAIVDLIDDDENNGANCTLISTHSLPLSLKNFELSPL